MERRTRIRKKVKPFFWKGDRVYEWEYWHGTVLEWDNEVGEILVRFDEEWEHVVSVIDTVTESEHLEILEFISDRERKLWQKNEESSK
jgi:hypothetical protein